MQFGICFKGDLDPGRTKAICRQAELAGFEYAWFYDSHILWRDPYPVMAMCMEHTQKMRFGPCVTNPDVRDWSVAASLFGSLALQSEGRIDICVGRGDSSRRMMGFKPASISRMNDFIAAVKAMCRGERVVYDDCPSGAQLTWSQFDLRVWIAAYGPKALAAAGEHGDGLVLQIGEPGLCRWFVSQALEAGKRAGRDMSTYRVMAAAPAWIGPMERCIAQTRWFPAMVGNHVADIVEKYGRDSNLVPASFTKYIERRKGYDYHEHAKKDASHLDFVTDDVVESFSVLGPAENHVAKLKELEAAGVTQFTIYLMNTEEERIVAEYGDKVIPHFV
ncbi:MAG TPA: TIGR03842 family LLM class F420-dependent oxidoreductase [Vicinamibacteria bacterium]|nr:TIGR03842 family LLM class F420-dependent oxidoreductase [Vicinamibacteria bacterium]